MSKPRPQPYGWHKCFNCLCPIDISFTETVISYDKKPFCSHMCLTNFAYSPLGTPYLRMYVNLY